ncbi:MAG: hypothetical protein ACK4IU_16525 [Tabrizicola flagellatus]|uniref:hypothetical protein n=1 Tax=Tabrizicola flagellatus TaxID=2593021 RepID=UPI003918DBC3
MDRFALALAVTLSLAIPASAQSLTILLPSLSFPTETVTPSSKGCEAPQAGTTCQPAE